MIGFEGPHTSNILVFQHYNPIIWVLGPLGFPSQWARPYTDGELTTTQLAGEVDEKLSQL